MWRFIAGVLRGNLSVMLKFTTLTKRCEGLKSWLADLSAVVTAGLVAANSLYIQPLSKYKQYLSLFVLRRLPVAHDNSGRKPAPAITSLSSTLLSHV